MNLQTQAQAGFYGHTYMLQGMKDELVLQMGTDKTTRLHIMSVSWSDFLTSRVQPDRDGGLDWYTGGSKANEGTLALVYGLHTRGSLASALGYTL